MKFDRRTIENMVRILKESDAELIIYDHHLPRETKFKERTDEVWRTAEKLGKKLVTASEFMGRKPVVFGC